jgi:acyl-CoA thioesterase FadM
MLLVGDAVGYCSVRYALTITGPDGLAVSGHITACLIDPESGRATCWPDDLRAALQAGGTSQS